MPNKSPIPTWFSALALVGQIGWVVAVPIVAGVLLGRFLDNWAGAHGLILVGMILLGVAGGIYGAYRVLAKEIRWKQ